MSPSTPSLFAGDTRQLTATTLGANNEILANRTITWTTSDRTRATVSSNGLVTAVAAGTATITATSEGTPGTAAVTIVIAPTSPFKALTAGWKHTCGLTTAGAAYCWGQNANGQLGDGTVTSRLTPVAVLGGIVFAGITAASDFTCGLTSAGAAYCWGNNIFGMLGDSSTTDRWFPAPVRQRGLVFTALDAADYHVCGLTNTGDAYCWGYGGFGQLGTGTGARWFDGSHTLDRGSPASAVVGRVGFTFTALSEHSRYHTCGLANTGAAYCWGYNLKGQLGAGYAGATDTTVSGSDSAVAVRGGLVFKSLTAGDYFTCALTLAGAAYCWGTGGYGQLGDGLTSIDHTSSIPVPVTGGHVFTALSAGSGAYHACGLTSTGAAYCWGYNNAGQLGSDATITLSGEPLAVQGGFTFAALTAGWSHTCGVTRVGAAYCWGDNEFGQLGDGTTTNRLKPAVAVVAQ